MPEVRANPPPSRGRMLEAAIDLMRGFGLAGAGINDIVRQSGAPKGSVYHFFPGGKLQIAGEALAVYAGRVEAFIDEALAGRRSNPERVRALFEAFAARAEQNDFRRSCAVGTVSLDLGDDAEPLRPWLVSALESWLRVIEHHIDLGDARRTRSFASLVLTVIEGAYVRARAEGHARAFREAGAWLAPLASQAGA
ncbi:MAG: TetR/AcrR family transcriptional regulator [Aquincola sp.]|nr:TetR/AcrR family transcriptional regulator [Aquincola sp.]MDH5329038.1 TetR/AcrR family transcriptional regulator [Aquincola sp.]